MRNTIIFCALALILMSSVLAAQIAPITFEAGGQGAG